jgi:hypothetical protein
MLDPLLQSMPSSAMALSSSRPTTRASGGITVSKSKTKRMREVGKTVAAVHAERSHVASIHSRALHSKFPFDCCSSCSLRVRRLSRVVMEGHARCWGRGRPEGILERPLVAQYAGRLGAICATCSPR